MIERSFLAILLYAVFGASVGLLAYCSARAEQPFAPESPAVMVLRYYDGNILDSVVFTYGMSRAECERAAAGIREGPPPEGFTLSVECVPHDALRTPTAPEQQTSVPPPPRLAVVSSHAARAGIFYSRRPNVRFSYDAYVNRTANARAVRRAAHSTGLEE